jgi:hypothetical protein
VVQDVGKKNNVERFLVEWDMGPVEYFHWDMGSSARQHVNSPHTEVRSLGLKNRGDQAVAAADVQDAGSLGSKLGKPARQGLYPAVEYQLVVQDSDRAHKEMNPRLQSTTGWIGRAVVLDCGSGRLERAPETLQATSLRKIHPGLGTSGTKRTSSRREIRGCPLTMRMNWSC